MRHQFAFLRKLAYTVGMLLESDDFRTPGHLLEYLLREKGWSQRLLAVVLGMDETGVNRIVANKRPIDAPLALTLEEVFHVPAERFLDLQKSYDLALARIEVKPDPERATRARLYGDLPVSDMIKRGWIKAKDIRDPLVRPELMRFFQANRIEDIEILPHAAKKTNVNTTATPAQLAWLYRVKQIASGMLVARYAPSSAASAIAKLKPLLSAAEEARKVPRVLGEHGIRFLIVEALPSSKIDGVCFWLNEISPVVALTMRFDRIDNFWFVLRHELEHVHQRHGVDTTTTMLDAELEGERAGTGSGVDEEERVANEAAADFCVPKKMMDAFYTRKYPMFREDDIIAFSRMIKVHPGLIAGQLRHRTNKYHLFQNHLAKVRSIVTPNAITDGWGNLAPLGT
ncbi:MULTISPECIES: helix-turn-helix domain-containing protein [unclassified Bradyrhizobium]|uniref:helix-turn-helix domain-containing protein n=1 Tax=unclassified Bradyrhizobium TaxID=2631580 RepID=UPI0033975F86